MSAVNTPNHSGLYTIWFSIILHVDGTCINVLNVP